MEAYIKNMYKSSLVNV